MAECNSFFRIASFNANGLGNHIKRKDVFDYLRCKSFDIILLQETHLKYSSENFVRSCWGYECLIAGNDSNKGGVAILFNNTFDYKIHNCIRGNENCHLILDIELCGKRLTLVNVYGPSDRDNADFFNALFDQINNIGNDNIIIGGDWNVILNPSLDTRHYAGNINKPRSRRSILDAMIELDLTDIFRYLYPDKKCYSWRRFNTTQQGRLDYFLVSESMLQSINGSDIMPGYRSDHSIVTVCLKRDKVNERCRSYWKFNNSLLYDKKYIELVKKSILETKKQYAVPLYNFDNLCSVSNEDIHFLINDQLFFETLLLEIRGKTISYACHKKKTENLEEKNLLSEIERLELLNVLDEDSKKSLDENRTKLEILRNKKLQGMIIRSRMQWIDQGEKPSRYFCSLEKRNFVSKQMICLEKENGELVFETNEIIDETKNFYNNLYSKKDINNVNLNDILQAPVKLNDQEKDSLEGLISFQEAHTALKGMKSNKSPGSDGFSVEFFKFFFVDIGHFLVRSVNHGFIVGNLSVTQKQGIITCIPKDGKDKRFIKNWRPISLLNVAYKITSACIANRIKTMLPKLIHNDQKGFMSGRYIGENIRLVYDIISYTEQEQMPGLLLLVDFEKAFDSLSWDFIGKVLEFLNFGSDIRRWIKVFYTDICSCISLNGSYSTWFNICRGVRQGDPLSPYLYLLCAEILSTMLRENARIKGINIDNQDILLSQFADDTALCLDGSEESFNESVRVLTMFAEMSGLKINFQKTQVVWLGSQKNCNIRYLRDKNFLWDPGIFCYLGVQFSLDIASIPNLNFARKFDEIKSLLCNWKKRRLTPFGKITVVKTLALSKITYLCTNIPDPSNKFIKDLDKLFFEFIWNEKPSKICENVLIKSYDQGGLNMICLNTFLLSMKLSWISRLLQNSSFSDLTFAMYPDLRDVHKLGTQICNKLSRNMKNQFWIDVMLHFKHVHSKCKPTDLNEFVSECLFFNECIAVGGTYVFYRHWVSQGIFQIHQLLDDNGQFLNIRNFQLKYPTLRTNFLELQSLINAIRIYAARIGIVIQADYIDQEPKVMRLIKAGSKQINLFLKNLNANLIPTGFQKWNNKFNNLNWDKILTICHKTTKESKLKWFQYRLLHRILPTNRFLHLRNIRDNNLCSFCNREEESVSHLFWDCDIVKNFWTNLQNLLIANCTHIVNLQFDEELILFGTKENMYTDDIFDLILLLAKYYIYSLKWTDSVPNITVFRAIVKNRHQFEKYRLSNQTQKFNTLWFPYVNFVN